MIKSFVCDERGVSMIEYGLLAALIAVVCLTTLSNLGSTLNTVFLRVSKGLYLANAIDYFNS